MAMNDFADSKVTVKKDELLSTIRRNRLKHAEEYTTALIGYREAVVAKLEEMLETAKKGPLEVTHVGLVEPQDHTKDYDRVIRMLEMSTASEITITEQQFSQFVLDEWNWQAAFKASTARYMGKH